MLKIKIISVGSIKEKYWQEAINEYIKRLKPYATIELKEIEEEKIVNVTERKKILAKEGEKIIKAIPTDGVVLALDKVGKSFSSEEWSRKLEEWSRYGQELIFIIGGPLGLDTSILHKAQEPISLSKMTFTHQMARVILLEQLYRGLMIAKGKQYHY